MDGGKLTNRDGKNRFERNKLFVRMEKNVDLLFQLMKHETNTLHVVFIFLFSIYLNFQLIRGFNEVEMKHLL